jgi:putative endonuclease
MTGSASPLLPSSDVNTRTKGASAETVAADYLVSKGYSIICRNYRKKIGEIDCIARDSDGTTVFVEVKSARTGSCGHPFSWVTPQKQRQIARVARYYLAQQGSLRCACRFDVIAVLNDKIEHLKNAFLV